MSDKPTILSRRPESTGSAEKDPRGQETLDAPKGFSEAGPAVDDVMNVSAFTQRYADSGCLGQGGMGEVRLCRDVRTDREVALKRIDGQKLDARKRARFLREARIQAKLDHPTIVPVYDIGRDEAGNEYFTMKRANGVTLAEVLRRLALGDEEFQARYPLPKLLGVFRQVCQGAAYAHSRGVIHRDLKPENIVVGELGQTFLLDWGIAKLAPAAATSIEQPLDSHGGPGTPGYMAPEQMQDGEAVDARADIYALGAILFEILTLEPLHHAESVDQIIEDTLRGNQDARIRERRPELTVAPELERACVQATRLDRNERFERVEDLLRVVGGYLDGDRDLAFRKSLAVDYTRSAQEALTTLLTEGDPGDQLRVRALRAAGHALALDPQAQDAVDVVTTLMRTPPTTVPEEVAADIERQEAAKELVGARMGVAAYLPFMIPLGMFMGYITNWAAALWVFVPYVLGVVLVALYARKVTPNRPPALLVDGMMLLTCSATCILLGPYMLMPQLLTAFATGATINTRAAVDRARYWIPLCFLATVVPVFLLAADLLPVSVEVVNPSSLVVRHHISDLNSPVFVHSILSLVTLLSVMVPVLFAYGNAATIRRLRARLVLQMWQLRQMGSPKLTLTSSPPASHSRRPKAEC